MSIEIARLKSRVEEQVQVFSRLPRQPLALAELAAAACALSVTSSTQEESEVIEKHRRSVGFWLDPEIALMFGWKLLVP